MRRLFSWGIPGLAIAIAVACGGRVLDTGTGSGGSGSGAGGSSTGAGGVVTTGTGGATTTGTGGTTTGTGGSTVGGTTMGTGGMTVGGTTTGTGGSGAKGGSGGTSGSGGAGGALDPGLEWSSCTGPGQCELVMAKCCLCGILGLGELAAINSTKRDAFSKQICGTAPLPCPPCVGTIEPHLMARCEGGRCRGFDILSDPTYTKCGNDSECTLRKGLSCCQCQALGDWVAISYVGDKLIAAETCGAGSVCPSCIPVPPAGTSAVCRNGSCVKSP